MSDLVSFLEKLEEFKSVEVCLVRKFFAKQEKLPAHKRQSYCHISCPCKKCSPCLF